MVFWPAKSLPAHCSKNCYNPPHTQSQPCKKILDVHLKFPTRITAWFSVFSQITITGYKFSEQNSLLCQLQCIRAFTQGNPSPLMQFLHYLEVDLPTILIIGSSYHVPNCGCIFSTCLMLHVCTEHVQRTQSLKTNRVWLHNTFGARGSFSKAWQTSNTSSGISYFKPAFHKRY